MDDWIKRKIRLEEDKELTREALETYQRDKLIETIKMAKENSPFYREHLKDVNVEEIKEISDIERLPFLEVKDVRENGLRMLCTRQNDISRIVTQQTSGTTGESKKIYFTEEDQELTIDFFHHGMRYIVNEEDVVLILMSSNTPGSLGTLLHEGIERLGARAILYGMPDDFGKISKVMADEGVTSIVGLPFQTLQLAQFCEGMQDINIKTVLLSADYVPDSLCRLLEKIWGCKVFEHYGMTETGLGGSVSCGELRGMHPREADLYFEIIDPKTGDKPKDGEFGEIVITTLTRKGMPFIRYKTGDYSRWLAEPCPCGTVLKSIDKVRPRTQIKNKRI